MATKNIEMNIMTDSNTYDTLLPKTDYTNITNTPTIPTAATFQSTYDNRYLLQSGGTIAGDLRLQRNGEYFGTSLNFGDGNYVYLKETTDDALEIKGDKGIKLTTGNSGKIMISSQNKFYVPIGEYGVAGEQILNLSIPMSITIPVYFRHIYFMGIDSDTGVCLGVPNKLISIVNSNSYIELTYGTTTDSVTINLTGSYGITFNNSSAYNIFVIGQH